MTFRRFLRLDRTAEDAPGSAPTSEGGDETVRASEGEAARRPEADTATVRRIVAQLEALPPEKSRFLAGFAYVLSRAAHADLEISDE